MSEVHASAPANPNWPLCRELLAREIGWTTDEIEDGELVDDPIINTDRVPEDYRTADRDWFTSRPVDCRECRELVHA